MPDEKKKKKKRMKGERGQPLKASHIQIRATPAQKALLMEAAAKSGLGLSSWMLSLSLAEAQRKLDG